MSESAVASLAILKVNWERLGRDYLDNIVPFVVAVVCTGRPGVVSLPVTQTAIRDEFGLLLPLNPLKTVLSRMGKLGHIRRESGVYVTQNHQCDYEQFAALRNATSDKITRLVAALVDHARDHFALEWSRAHSEQALLAFVTAHGLDALYAQAEGRLFPTVEIAVDDQFVVGAFVIWAQASSPRLFEDVLDVVKGHVLSNALYLPDTGSVKQRFSKTTIYFDTSFLVYACGFAGADRRAPCSELLTLLKKHGARLSCFRETVEEARGILDACAGIVRRGDPSGYGPSVEHFLQSGVSSTDIDLLAARCEAHIEALGVTIEDRPGVERRYQIDETGLERALDDAVGYRKRSALVHDVDCISAIMRLRRGTESHSIENCRAIFLTANAALAMAARNFFLADSPPGTISPALSSHALGHILWLKDPTAAPELTVRQVIADASAAMQPSERLWKVYLAEIARLESSGAITGEEYYLLRHAHSAKRALMDLTHGESDAFVEGSVPEILEAARRHVRAALEGELATAKEQLKEKDAEIVERENRDRDRSATLERRAAQIAHMAVICLLSTGVVGLVVATIYSSPWNLPQPQRSWARYALTAFQAGLLMYTITSMIWGTTIVGLMARLERRLTPSVLAQLSAWLGASANRRPPEGL